MTDEQSSTNHSLAKLAAGQLVEFVPRSFDNEETDEERLIRTIPAKWIEDLVAGPNRVLAQDVKIKNAIISGSLNLGSVIFEGELSFINCEFHAGDAPHYAVDFSYATFNRIVTFASSQFFQ